MQPLAIKRLLSCLLGALMPVSLAIWAAQGEGPETPFQDLLVRWNDTLDFTERVLTLPHIGKREIRPLLENITVVQESAQGARERAEQELAKHNNLLDALGPPPEEGDPAESADIAAKRNAITQQVARYDGQVKQSNVVFARATNLLGQIADVEIGTLARLLSKRSPPPLSPGILTNAVKQLPERLQGLGREGVEWWSQKDFVPERGTRVMFLLVTSLAILIAWWGARYWLLRRYGRDATSHGPTTPHRKLVATLVESVARVVLPVLAVLLLTFMVIYILILGHELRSIVNRLAIAALHFVIITGLSKTILAPRYPSMRMTTFSDQAAIQLDRSLTLFAGTAFVFYLVMAVSGVAMVEPLLVTWLVETQAPAELSAVVGMTALLVLGMLLLKLLRPSNWRFIDADTDPPSTCPPSAIYRLLFNFARAGLIISIIAGAFGYLNFGLFVSKRIVWTLALLGVAWLIHGLVAAGTKLATSDANTVGAWVRQRLSIGDAGGTRLVFWLVLLADVLLFLTVAMMILLIWGMPWTEVKPIFTGLADGIEIGNFEFSLFNVAFAIIVFVALAIGVRLLQRLLSNRILVQTSLDIGVRDALTAGVGYVGIVLAVLITFSVLGLNLGELAIIFGALSVGIGFGLQHTVNNFVSGLILLVQRPIKAGDWIVIGNNEGYVKHINVISTEIQTFDNASLIVPNSNLVTTEVMNWMHKSKVGRVIIPVGVSYGSNPEQVREVLLKCADENSEVLGRPVPQVIFREFGNSSLDFELRFYIRDIDGRLRTASDLRFAIKKAFDEAGIEIPFPQRDIHIRDVISEADTPDSDRLASSSGEQTKITRIHRSTQGQVPAGDDKLETKE